MVCFAGHTDVVPTGDLNQWSSDHSFRHRRIMGTCEDGGPTDMKSSLALVVACEEFLGNSHSPNGRIIFY